MSYAQLSSEEHYVIYHLKLFKLSLREIARRLKRHHITISREIKRNGPERPAWSTGTQMLTSERCSAEDSAANTPPMQSARTAI